ncbi:MAG: helix-turn-helix domain-containing protein [Marinobacter sp.]|uniref:helix-turn-helix transcriptional regulator n=1 Tax=Marinobacter sp. TaxID=50741 RepID=UPI0034A08F32
MQYLSDKHISERYEVSRQTVWRWVREGKFPAPLKLGPNCTRWKLSDVEAWEASKEVAA